jgi:hypothetical protein
LLILPVREHPLEKGIPHAGLAFGPEISLILSDDPPLIVKD